MKTTKLDLTKCKIAMSQLSIQGSPINGTDGDGHPLKHRSSVIEDAIKAIQKEPQDKVCFGVKNYSSFGDQRFDMDGCPRHGHIVFRVTRKGGFRGDFDRDACVYFLQAVRDFKPYPDKILNLSDALQKVDIIERELKSISQLIEKTQFDFENAL